MAFPALFIPFNLAPPNLTPVASMASSKPQMGANEFQYILINITLANFAMTLYPKEYLETKWGTACALNVEPC
jgi:hypothetical protein